MRKRIVAVFAILMLVCLPAYAFAGEAGSSGDSASQSSQAQTSEQLIKLIDGKFAAMQAEAKKDATRVKETTPEILDMGAGEGDSDDDDDDDTALPICKITRDGKAMKYIIGVKGEPDATGYPLYITLHGGGEG